MNAPREHDPEPPAATRRDRFLIVAGCVWLGLLASSLRFESPHFRPYERLIAGQRFRPQQRLVQETSGDLAHGYWLPDRRVLRETTFSTDRHGLRNPREELSPRVVVTGDSYVVGAGLSDEETVSARLAQELGEPVSNYGVPQEAAGPSLYTQDARFIQRPARVLLYMPTSRFVQPLEQKRSQGVRPHPTLKERLTELRDAVEYGNSLRRLCRTGFHGLRHALDPPPSIRVDGQEALVLSLEDQRLLRGDERQLERTVSTLLTLADYLEQRGTTLVYAPVPEPGSIYPEAFPPDQRAQLADPPFLDRVFERLAPRVRVVDLRPVFRAARHPYLYQLDDSHWNARAVELTSRTLAGVLREQGLLSAR